MTPTTLANYQERALRTEKKLPTHLARMDHAGIGLFTEGGEIATCVKRIAIYGKTLDDLEKAPPGVTPKTIRAHLGEEIGDAFWYVAIAADTAGAEDFFSAEMPKITGVVDATLPRASRTLAGFVGTFNYLVEADATSDQAYFDCLRAICQALVSLAELADLNIEGICAANIAKLQERFPGAYSDEAAEARADKGGLDARNS